MSEIFPQMRSCGHESEFSVGGKCENCARRNGFETLRPYQKIGVKKVFQKYQEGNKSVVLCLPTGAGKTRVCAEIVALIYRKLKQQGKPANFILLSHRRELREQMALALEKAEGLKKEVGVVANARKQNNIGETAIQVLTIQTFARLLKSNRAPRADFIVIDEAHRAKASQYVEVFKAYPEAKFLGLTATPVRLDRKPLNDVFESLVTCTTTRKLIAEGFLSPYRLFARFSPDLKGIRSRGGDYNEEELETVMNTHSSNQCILDEYKKHGTGKKGIFFAVNVRHSETLAEFFNDAGIPSKSLTGGASEAVRVQTLEDFKNRKILCLFNCQILTEGFDDPDIELVGLLCPTKSLTRYLQAVGRALRIAEGKEAAIVLDHAGLWMQHGKPDDIFHFENYFFSGYGSQEKTEVQYKTCPECFAVVAKNLKECPLCGYVFADRILRGGRTQSNLLEQPLIEIVAYTAKNEGEEAERILKVIEKARGYKPGWHSHIVEELEKKDKQAYFREFFYSILAYENQEKVVFDPNCLNHIAMAKTLDPRSVHSLNWRQFNGEEVKIKELPPPQIEDVEEAIEVIQKTLFQEQNYDNYEEGE